MIDSERGDIDYDECGEGPTVVLVPGSCSTGAAWRAVIAAWSNRFRCVTTSLLGYGGTGERRSALDPDISHEAEIIEAVIVQAGCPVHLVGHSFGALTALAVALRNRVPLLSLTLAEAPALGLLRLPAESEHFRAFEEMTGAYFKAFQAGDPEAIGRMIDFYGGPGTFAAWPPRVRNYAIETTAVNILDWSSAYGFSLEPAILATVSVPTLVLRGAASHPALQRANEILAQSLAKASMVTLAGAAHFMIMTHPQHVAAVIARHIARAEEGDRAAVSALSSA